MLTLLLGIFLSIILFSAFSVHSTLFTKSSSTVVTCIVNSQRSSNLRSDDVFHPDMTFAVDWAINIRNSYFVRFSRFLVVLYKVLTELQLQWGAGIALWLERRTPGRKVAGSNHRRSGGRIFFSRVNFLC